MKNEQVNSKKNNLSYIQIFVFIISALIAFVVSYLVFQNLGETKIIVKDRLYQGTQTKKSILTGRAITGLDDDEINEILTGHSSAPQESWITKEDTLCIKLGGLCKKLTFDATISDYDRYAYTLLLGHTISKLESYGYPTLEATINTITIQQPKGGRRGYAGHDLIVFNVQNVKSFSEFYQVATHELGHILDLGVIQGNSQSFDPNYTEFGEVVFASDDDSLNYYKLSRINENTKKADSSFKDYVSGYGMTNPFEDFAESVNMYINNNDLFSSMAQGSSVLGQKYRFMQHIFAGNFTYHALAGNKSLKQQNRRPRDSTRLSN